LTKKLEKAYVRPTTNDKFRRNYISARRTGEKR
jgi:hypothetical protein